MAKTITIQRAVNGYILKVNNDGLASLTQKSEIYIAKNKDEVADYVEKNL
jgi:uncharacterized protein YehS (DUF1456 family)